MLFSLLADYACNNEAERILLLQWAVRVGAIAIREHFTADLGYFWGINETRPYMRARFSLARALRDLGCYEEAIAHFEALMQLDTDDHCGVRLILMSAYLEIGNLAAAHKLINEHLENSGPYGAYSAVIYAWLSNANDKTFDDALRRALLTNVHVPALLENPDLPIERSPFGVGRDRPDGGDDYLSISCRLWEGHPKLKRRVILKAKKLLPGVKAQQEEEIREMRRRAGLPERENPPES
ncbi:MAG: tetratricopeptide repeat protein [Chthoniobacter sp.]|nr:tetratricopeptide repeat protein [Chthoniobacter sp.]